MSGMKHSDGHNKRSVLAIMVVIYVPAATIAYQRKSILD
jgi:hypothetical protein